MILSSVPWRQLSLILQSALRCVGHTPSCLIKGEGLEHERSPHTCQSLFPQDRNPQAIAPPAAGGWPCHEGHKSHQGLDFNSSHVVTCPLKDSTATGSAGHPGARTPALT